MDTIRTSVDIPRDLHRRLHEVAARRGCSARSLILESLERFVASTGPVRQRRKLRLALMMGDHRHRASAIEWWNLDQSDQIEFSRLTQVGVLRLLTTAAAMNGQPLTMKQAWRAYDELFLDVRVVSLPEPAWMEADFRRLSSSTHASPKVWADAYIAAFAAAADAEVITFDWVLATRCVRCRRLEEC